jgi:hypothetical protein
MEWACSQAGEKNACRILEWELVVNFEDGVREKEGEREREREREEDDIEVEFKKRNVK